MTSEISGAKPCIVFFRSKPSTEASTKCKESTENQPLFSSKAQFFKNLKDIDKCTSINGIPIEEIERRARPRGYSQAGFLGENESFKEVLKKDWETVEQFNVTHCEIVAHLRNVIAIAKRAEENIKRTFENLFDPVEIEYRPNDLEGSTLVSEKRQQLQVNLCTTRGMQEDLFEPEEGKSREVETPQGWNEEYSVVNPENGAEVNLNSGILKYIELFGFYEGGGDSNRYRVDPKSVIAILTGKSINI